MGNCYVRVEDPQPPSDHAIWAGNTAGVIVVCTPYPCVTVTGATIPDCPSISRYWAPAAPASIVIDEGAAARRAIAQLDLDPIQISMAPQPNLAEPNVLIGAPAYFWAEGGTPAIGPLTTTVAQDGITITLSARLDDVTFDTGDGATVTCPRDVVAERPTHMALDDTPACGHAWSTSATYVLTATSAWTIDWQGPSQSGTLDHALTATTDVAVIDRPTNLTTNEP